MQDSRKDSTTNSKRSKQREGKSAYQTPTVTDYGDVARLTQGVGTAHDGTHAGGAVKNPYL